MAKAKRTSKTIGQTHVVFVIDSEFCATLGEFLVKRGDSNKELVDFGHKLTNLVPVQNYRIDLNPAKIKAAIKRKAKIEAKQKEADRGQLVKEAKRLHKKGESYRAIGKTLGVSAITVSRYCNK